MSVIAGGRHGEIVDVAHRTSESSIWNLVVVEPRPKSGCKRSIALAFPPGPAELRDRNGPGVEGATGLILGVGGRMLFGTEKGAKGFSMAEKKIEKCAHP